MSEVSTESQKKDISRTLSPILPANLPRGLAAKREQISVNTSIDTGPDIDPIEVSVNLLPLATVAGPGHNYFFLLELISADQLEHHRCEACRSTSPPKLSRRKKIYQGNTFVP